MRVLKNVLLAILLSSIFFAMGRALWENWNRLTPLLDKLSYPLALLSILICVGSYLFISFIWTVSLRELDATLPFAKSVRIVALSMMGRYIPGKVWTLMGRIYLAEREGVPKSKSLLTSYLEISLQIVFGTLLFLGCFFFFGGTSLPEGIKIFIYILPVLLLFLHPRIFEKGLNWALRLMKKEPLEIRLNFGHILGLGAFYTFNWLILGLGVYCALYSFYPVDFSLVPLLSGVFAFSWAVGFLALIFPGGIGVREGIMCLLLGMWIPAPIAVMLAILSRFLFTIAEVIFFSLALLGQKGWINQRLSQMRGKLVGRNQ